MEFDDLFDELTTQHIALKISQSKVIPCNCGEFREINQNNKTGLLMTECSNCKSKEPFNMADLTIIGYACIRHAGEKGENKYKLNAPNISYTQLWKTIEDIEDWNKEINKLSRLRKLKVVQGGIQ